MGRQTAVTTKPLSAAERRTLVVSAAQRATGRVRAGIKLIDFREPTAEERAVAEKLEPKARKILADRRQVA
jgi:hypothetical protein